MWTSGDQQKRIWEAGSCEKREDRERAVMDMMVFIFVHPAFLPTLFPLDSLRNSSHFIRSLAWLSVTVSDPCEMSM